MLAQTANRICLALALLLLLGYGTEALSQSRQEIFSALQSSDRRSKSAAITAALKSDDPLLHHDGLLALAKLATARQQQKLPEMLDLYHRASLKIRQEILMILSQANYLTDKKGEIIDGIPQLFGNILRQGQDQERLLILYTMTRLGEKVSFAIPALLAAYPKAGPQVRRQILGIFGQAGQDNRQVLQLLQQELTSNDQHLRWQAAFAIGRIGKRTPEILARLYQNLDDRIPGVVARSAQALGKLAKAADRHIWQKLWRLSRHQNPLVRIHSLQALSANPTDKLKAANSLQRELADRNPMVRLLAAEAILQANPKATAAVETLLAIAKTNMPDQAIVVIAKLHLDHPDIIMFLQRTMASSQRDLRIAALSALAVTHYHHGNPNTAYFRSLYQREKDPELKIRLQRILRK